MSTPLSEDDSRGRYLSQGQVLMLRSALAQILANAEALQESPLITQPEKGQLEEIKKDAHGIARILKQGRPEDCEEVLEGVVGDVGEILKGLHGIERDLQWGR